MPIWLCLTCYGTAHGWADGSPCIHCGSAHVVGTEDAYRNDMRANVIGYRLVRLNRREWERVQRAADESGQSVRAYLAKRERAGAVAIRDVGVDDGKLVLCNLYRSTAHAPRVLG